MGESNREPKLSSFFGAKAFSEVRIASTILSLPQLLGRRPPSAQTKDPHQVHHRGAYQQVLPRHKLTHVAGLRISCRVLVALLGSTDWLNCVNPRISAISTDTGTILGRDRSARSLLSVTVGSTWITAEVNHLLGEFGLVFDE